MEIVIHKNPVSAKGPDVTFVLGDTGSAHVTLTLRVADLEPIVRDETYEGPLTVTRTVAAGSNDCTFIVKAFKPEALGPTYDSSLNVDGQAVASAKGAIPSDKDYDSDFKHFTLIVG